MQDHYEQYALIEAQIAELEEKKAGLRTKIVEGLVAQGVEKVTSTLGTFTISKLKRWTYPAIVEEKMEEVKTLKAKFESTGEATYVETPSLRFTSIKI